VEIEDLSIPGNRSAGDRYSLKCFFIKDHNISHEWDPPTFTHLSG
jgi:hypothetical protein